MKHIFLYFAEKSPHALSYLSVILGAIVGHLMLRATTRNTLGSYQEILIYCTNTGVPKHGNNTKLKLKENRTQCDVLYAMKGLVPGSPVNTVFNWVEGHLFEKKDLRNFSHLEIMNNCVGRLEDDAI